MAGAITLKKILTPHAQTICKDIDVGPEAKKCLEAESDPVAYLNALMEQNLYVDAVRFLARALPKREATWWACLSARCTVNEKSPPELITALTAAEAWVFSPTEPNRRKSHTAAQAANFDNAASWAAMAAFWSEGNMAPEDVPAVVPPPDNLSSKAVAGAVMLSAVQTQPEKADEKYVFFIEQAIDIANGGNGKVWQV